VFFRAILLTIVALIATSSYGATPKSIRYVEEVTTRGGNLYAHYKVTCSDNKKADISAWNDGKKWCVGRGQQDRCAKKRVKIARRVCDNSK